MLYKMEDRSPARSVLPGATIKMSKDHPAAWDQVPTTGQHTERVLSRVVGYPARNVTGNFGRQR